MTRYTTSQTVSIPLSAYNIKMTVAGAKGGNGGSGTYTITTTTTTVTPGTYVSQTCYNNQGTCQSLALCCGIGQGGCCQNYAGLGCTGSGIPYDCSYTTPATSVTTSSDQNYVNGGTNGNSGFVSQEYTLGAFAAKTLALTIGSRGNNGYDCTTTAYDGAGGGGYQSGTTGSRSTTTTGYAAGTGIVTAACAGQGGGGGGSTRVVNNLSGNTFTANGGSGGTGGGGTPTSSDTAGAGGDGGGGGTTGGTNDGDGWVDITYDVLPPPTINTFTASSSSIINGNPVTLAWSTSNANSFSINGNAVTGTSASFSPTTTTTYTLSVSGFGGGPITSSVTVTVYQPPVLTLTVDRNPIVNGDGGTTLRWSFTGDASSISWSSGGISSSNLSGNTPVSPNQTTTYTATISGNGGSSTKTVTLVVYQIPTATLSVPVSLLYGQQGTITYSSCYSNTSLVLTPTYSYSNASGASTVVGTAVSLTRPNSAEIGVGTTCVNNQTITTAIPYNTSGPRSVSYALAAVGSGGNKTVLGPTTIIIDETPDNINIPEIDDVVKSQDPVYTPKATSTITLRVVDIDIPVEIKSNRAIKVEINDDNIWKDVRLM